MRTNLSKLLVLVLACLGAGSRRRHRHRVPPTQAVSLGLRAAQMLFADAIPFASARHEENDCPTTARPSATWSAWLIEPDFDLIQRAESEVGFSEKQFRTGTTTSTPGFWALDPGAD